jgi:hypothetical protein
MAPKFGDRLIVLIEQGGTARAALDAADKTIDSIITTVVFSYCQSNPCRKAAKEQGILAITYILSREKLETLK